MDEEKEEDNDKDKDDVFSGESWRLRHEFEESPPGLSMPSGTRNLHQWTRKR